jgi:hypothetical protein
MQRVHCAAPNFGAGAQRQPAQGCPVGRPSCWVLPCNTDALRSPQFWRGRAAPPSAGLPVGRPSCWVLPCNTGALRSPQFWSGRAAPCCSDRRTPKMCRSQSLWTTSSVCICAAVQFQASAAYSRCGSTNVSLSHQEDPILSQRGLGGIDSACNGSGSARCTQHLSIHLSIYPSGSLDQSHNKE